MFIDFKVFMLTSICLSRALSLFFLSLSSLLSVRLRFCCKLFKVALECETIACLPACLASVSLLSTPLFHAKYPLAACALCPCSTTYPCSMCINLC